MKQSLEDFVHKAGTVSKDVNSKTIEFSKETAIKAKDVAVVVKDKTVDTATITKEKLKH